MSSQTRSGRESSAGSPYCGCSRNESDAVEKSPASASATAENEHQLTESALKIGDQIQILKCLNPYTRTMFLGAF